MNASIRAATAVLASLLLLAAPPLAAQRVLVADELDRLAAEHEFEIKGIERLADAEGRADRPQLYPRLRRLLEDFDHVIVANPRGRIERVIILGEKVPVDPSLFVQSEEPAMEQEDAAQGEEAVIVIDTVRKGTSHAVKVSLEGSEGKRVERILLVDTGADYVVLPRSLLDSLGYEEEGLGEREMQTANGKVTALLGTLDGVWLNDTRVAGVQAAFIEDGKLGGGGLLGMSLLGRYKMTIDDADGKLTLGKR